MLMTSLAISLAKREAAVEPTAASLIWIRGLDDVDRCAGLYELRLHRLRLGLVDTFFDIRRRGLDEVLRFLESQGRDLADGLDHVDLVRAEVVVDDVELCLLFYLWCRRVSA